jgi:hypothetical protein
MRRAIRIADGDAVQQSATSRKVAILQARGPQARKGRLLSVDSIRTLPDQPVAPSSWCYAQKRTRPRAA